MARLVAGMGEGDILDGTQPRLDIPTAPAAEVDPAALADLSYAQVKAVSVSLAPGFRQVRHLSRRQRLISLVMRCFQPVPYLGPQSRSQSRMRIVPDFGGRRYTTHLGKRLI